MGDWNRSEMMCSRRYEKKRVRTRGQRGHTCGRVWHPARNEKFFVEGENYLLTGCPLMGDPICYSELNSLLYNCSNEEIFSEIVRVASLVDSPRLTAKDYDKFAKITSNAIRRRFGGRNTCLAAAGLEGRYSGMNVSEKMRQQ